MTISLFSRFQGCLLMTFLAAGEEGAVNGDTVTASLASWSTIFHSAPYPGRLPATVWRGDELHWPTMANFSQWLVVLALWHHENPAGFKEDLGRSVKKFTDQFPDRPLSPLDQTWLQLWQRLLTLILSERFTLSQLPEVLADCQRDLAAIALPLNHPHPPVLTQSPYAHSIPRAIDAWADTPGQPRLTIERFRSDPLFTLIAPCASALSGAYNGGNIVRQIIQPSFPQTVLRSSIDHFAQQHFLQWLGCRSPSSAFSALVSSAPLVMQRRSSLKLVSQQDYDQFS